MQINGAFALRTNGAFATQTYGAIDANSHAGLAVVRGRPVLLPDCHCHFCDETLQPEILFCNNDCRDAYEKVEAARARNGK